MIKYIFLSFSLMIGITLHGAQQTTKRKQGYWWNATSKEISKAEMRSKMVSSLPVKTLKELNFRYKKPIFAYGYAIHDFKSNSLQTLKPLELSAPLSDDYVIMFVEDAANKLGISTRLISKTAFDDMMKKQEEGKK